MVENVDSNNKTDLVALAKCSKKTERKAETTYIKQKDGSLKQVRKYKRKKRFGKSISSRSPVLFVVD